MKHMLTITVAAMLAMTVASAAQADCTVEYKAKQDNPLKLAHSTLVVPGPCTASAVKDKVRVALTGQGWTLLQVVSVSAN